MADNVGFTPGTGALIAADEIAGVLHQRVKMQFGADGEATDVSSADPLPVVVPGVSTDATLSALKASIDSLSAKVSACNTNDVELNAATLAALETVTIANPTAQGLTDAQLRDTPVPVSGTFYQATQPVSAVDFPLPNGATTEATQALVKTAVEAIVAALFATGGPYTLGDKGLLALGKRRDSDTAVVADGQLGTFNIDEEGRVKVSAKPASYVAASGSITANGQNVSISCGRFGNLSVSMIATSLVGHNAIFECSNNSTNGTDGTWYGVQAARSNANTADTTTGVLTATPAYMWHVNVSEYSYFRMRATAHTSGTAAYILRPGSNATEPLPIVQVTGTQPVSGTVALGAGTARVGFAAGAGIWYDDSAVALAAAASFTGTARDLTVTATATAMANAATYAKELRVSAESDQSGTLWLEVSRDNTNWRRVKAVATAAVTGGGQYAEIVHRPSWRYARVGFTNGATLQTRFAIGSMAVAL